MKKILLVALTALLVSAALPALAFGPLDLEAGLPLNSKYVWRGMNQNDDYVLQPCLDVSVFGFTAGVWGNWNLTDEDGLKGEFSEVDYKLAYALGLPFIDLGAGFLWYDYPKYERDNTAEFYLSAKANVFLSPSLALYNDIDKFKGTYWLATIGHGIKVGQSTQVDLSGGIGLGSENYIKGYFPVDSDLPWSPDYSIGASLTDCYLDARIPIHPIPLLTIAPSVTWTSLLGDAKDSVKTAPDGQYFSGKTDNFFWGLSALFSF